MRSFLAILATVSGLHGFVHEGPTAPVCRADDPCTAPARVTLVFRRAAIRDGRLVPLAHVRPAGVRSDVTGRYRAVLAPGYYTVATAERVGIGRSLTPHAVHVRRGHLDRLDFEIDTGIR